MDCLCPDTSLSVLEMCGNLIHNRFRLSRVGSLTGAIKFVSVRSS